MLSITTINTSIGTIFHAELHRFCTGLCLTTMFYRIVIRILYIHIVCIAMLSIPEIPLMESSKNKLAAYSKVPFF